MTSPNTLNYLYFDPVVLILHPPPGGSVGTQIKLLPPRLKVKGWFSLYCHFISRLR